MVFLSRPKKEPRAEIEKSIVSEPFEGIVPANKPNYGRKRNPKENHDPKYDEDGPRRDWQNWANKSFIPQQAQDLAEKIQLVASTFNPDSSQFEEDLMR